MDLTIKDYISTYIPTVEWHLHKPYLFLKDVVGQDPPKHCRIEIVESQAFRSVTALNALKRDKRRRQKLLSVKQENAKSLILLGAFLSLAFFGSADLAYLYA